MKKKLSQAEPPPALPYRSSLFTRKKPVRVTILMPRLTVNGQVHITEWQRSISAIDTDQMFLPVTNAVLTSSFNYPETEFDFIAVNRHKIISIVETGENE